MPKEKEKTDEQIERTIHRKNLIHMTLLVEYEKFRNDVSIVRDLSHIPSGGFKDNEKGTIADQLKTWRQEHGMSGKEWEYLEHLDKDSPFRLYHNFLPFLIDQNPQSEYGKWHRRTNDIRKKYFVPFHFQPYIELFILTNEIIAPDRNFLHRFNHSSSSNGLATATFTVYSLPTTEEKELIWRLMDPLKHINSQAEEADIPWKLPRTLYHKKDLLKEDIPIKDYADVLAIVRERKQARIPWKALAKGRKWKAGSMKSIFSKAKNLQKELFESNTFPR